VTTRAIKRVTAPVKSSPPTNQHPAFYRLDALPVTVTAGKAKAGMAHSDCG